MRNIWLMVGLTLPLLTGCGGKTTVTGKAISEVPEVQVARPEVRTITREVGQPSFIEAYEQTAIYAKLPAYVLRWNVNIGDRVKKGQEMATLFIPELVQEYAEKKALVTQDEALVQQAKKLVDVAKATLSAAEYRVKEARANVGQSQALVTRWDSEVERLNRMVKDRVVDPQVLSESQRQLQSNQAALSAANAAVDTAVANQLAAQASLEKAAVDVEVTAARLEVSKATRERLKALTGYLIVSAPYDGIVTLRNINSGDFVMPATGDPSAASRAPDQSASKGSPLYVVARTDKVRIYVDVSESDAVSIVSQVDKNAGDPRPVTQGKVVVFALDNVEIPAEATRAAWALNFKSRTLRTEIDLENVGARLLPGMYAFGKLVIKHKDVKALPVGAVTEIGNQFGCYVNVGGKSVWTPVQAGVNDGKWIEVQRRRINGAWVPFDGKEEVITSNLGELTNGGPVRIAASK